MKFNLKSLPKSIFSCSKLLQWIFQISKNLFLIEAVVADRAFFVITNPDNSYYKLVK